MATRSAGCSSRGRRSSRPSGDERERAILATAEQLLASRPLAEVSIDDLARGAGISRSTFYFYYPSKDAVLLALVDQVVAEVEAVGRYALDDLADDPVRTLGRTIDLFYRTFRSHRAVTLAAAQARGSNSEVEKLWSTVMQRWARLTATAIEGERTRGAAPEGVSAQDLATTLLLMNERVLYSAFSGIGPAVAEEDVVHVLLHLWLMGIYHTDKPERRPP